MIEFKLRGVDFNFLKENNQSISNFDWFVNYLKEGNWENFTFEIFEQCSDPNKIALDVGAWIGPTSIWLSKNFKEVYSFEPDPVAFEALKKNLASNNCNNVFPIGKALYKTKTTLGFGLNPEFAHEGPGASTSQIKAESPEFLVETTTFSELSKIIPFDQIGLVKVDIEGAEEFIIDDLFEYAAIHKWNVLIEIHPQFMSESGLANFQNVISKTFSKVKEGDNQKFFRFY
jgi:FkbM family methyltransferase